MRDVPAVAMTRLRAVVAALAASSAVAETSGCITAIGMEDDDETRLDTISLSSSWNALTISERPTPCKQEVKKQSETEETNLQQSTEGSTQGKVTDCNRKRGEGTESRVGTGFW